MPCPGAMSTPWRTIWSGASAAFAAGVKLGHLREKAEIFLPGGRLVFKIGKNGHVIVSGPAEISFFGELPEG